MKNKIFISKIILEIKIKNKVENKKIYIILYKIYKNYIKMMIMKMNKLYKKIKIKLY